MPFEDLAEGLVSKHLNEVPLEWFDREFKAALDIDIYEHPFPREQGFARIRAGPYEVLVMRHDLDDRQKERCVEELLGVRGVTIQPTNLAAQRPYGEVYRRFVNTVRLPRVTSRRCSTRSTRATSTPMKR